MTDLVVSESETTNDKDLQDQSLSVVIATRDRPKLLRRAIDAVVAQCHGAPLEVVVVFDRSAPDHSLTFDDGQRRLRVVANTRSPGLAGARNSGILAASHNWIALCDDDDEWLENKLVAQFKALKETTGARAACTGIFVHYEGNDTPRIPDQAELTFDGFLRDRMTAVHPSSWLVHRQSFVDQIGLVDEEIPGGYGEDYDFILRTVRHAPLAVAAEPLVRIWWHGGSYFFEKWQTIDRALDYLVEKYPEFYSQPSGLARIRGQQAIARAAMGQRRSALGTAWGAFRLSPTEKRVPVAITVAAGLPADRVLAFAHKFGKGI